MADPSTAARGADPVERWLLGEEARRAALPAVFDALCARLAAAGVPLWRASLNVLTLHPLILGYSRRWWRDRPAENETWPHGAEKDDLYLRSPLYPVVEHGETVRRRLEGAGPGATGAPLLEALRREGATDYLALPLLLADGRRFSASWATDRPSGFRDDDLANLAALGPALGLVADAKAARELATNLLETYLGRSVGAQVFQGRVRRGDGERFPAVVWYSDLRGFTGLTERLPPAALLDRLNAYFALVDEAVSSHGGEIVHLIGDAAVALFRVVGEGPGAAAAACAAAVAAAADALRRAGPAGGGRPAAGAPPLRFGVGLEVGPVTHGNVGSPARLGFNVVGAAVNRAARLEGLTKRLGAPLVFSQAVAAGLPGTLAVRPLGAHALRGVAGPQELFSLASLAA